MADPRLPDGRFDTHSGRRVRGMRPDGRPRERSVADGVSGGTIVGYGVRQLVTSRPDVARGEMGISGERWISEEDIDRCIARSGDTGENIECAEPPGCPQRSSAAKDHVRAECIQRRLQRPRDVRRNPSPGDQGNPPPCGREPERGCPAAWDRSKDPLGASEALPVETPSTCTTSTRSCSTSSASTMSA